MESLTTELISNASAQLFPENTLSSFTNFLPEQLNLENQWQVAISEISHPSMYQNVTEGKFLLFDNKFSNSSEFYYLGLELYLSFTDNVEDLNTLIQEKHKHSENCITAKVSRRTKKVDIYLTMKISGLAFFSTDLGHIFGTNFSNELGQILRRKGPKTPEFAHDNMRIKSFMLYTILIEYNIVDDTKALMLRCFPLFKAEGCRHFCYWRVHEPSDIQKPTIQTAAQMFFS